MTTLNDNTSYKEGFEFSIEDVKRAAAQVPSRDSYFNEVKKSDFVINVEFAQGFGEDDRKQGDFYLNINTDKIVTTVELYSQHSKVTDNWSKKEWRLEDMTNADWRVIERKIKRAQRKIENTKFVYECSLTFTSLKFEGKELVNNY